MTLAQAEAYLCGSSPEDHEPRFIAQLLSAYAFVKPFAVRKRVLEVGFGEGYGANDLAEVAQEVIGIDLAPGNVPRATARYPRENLRFCQMDATHLEFPANSFDVVCSFQVIEHIPESLLMPYLAEMSRVVRPDGLVCLSTLNLDHNMKPGKPYQKLIYHEKEFTAPELKALLQEAFPDVDLLGLHLTWKHRVFQRLKKWGLGKIGDATLNPIARFYQRVSVHDFVVSRNVSRAALDLIAICRKLPVHDDSRP